MSSPSSSRYGCFAAQQKKHLWCLKITPQPVNQYKLLPLPTVLQATRCNPEKIYVWRNSWNELFSFWFSLHEFNKDSFVYSVFQSAYIVTEQMESRMLSCCANLKCVNISSVIILILASWPAPYLEKSCLFSISFEHACLCPLSCCWAIIMTSIEIDIFFESFLVCPQATDLLRWSTGV